LVSNTNTARCAGSTPALGTFSLSIGTKAEERPFYEH
jgi:hypothetical protein